MAGKSDYLENGFLALLFNATAFANIADNASVSALTNLYVSLHTANPGDTGSQTTSEAGYSGYTRVAVARTSGGWTVSGTNPTSVSPVATISFPAAVSGTETETYFGIGTDLSGAGHLLYSGAISPTIGVSAGVTPQLTTASTITEE